MAEDRRDMNQASLSFDALTAHYDETRTFDASCFRAALDALVKRFPPRHFQQLFEPGIGNGRMAVPLREAGYRVVGADLAFTMLRDGMRRAPNLSISWLQADVTRLPYVDGCFDLAVATHLFYFIRDWRQAADELLRVVRPEGPIILMHTGNGMEIPKLNARYKALCAEMGCAIPTIGVQSTRELVAYYAGRGCKIEWWRDRWTWTAYIRLDAALKYIAARAYSFTTYAPATTHKTVVERLRLDLLGEFDTLEVSIAVPNQIYIVIVMR